MRLCLAMCHAMVLAAGELHAQDCFKTDSRVGGVAFVMPTGWRRLDGRGITTLVPGDVPQGKVAQIGLFAAQPLSGDLRSWFDAQWVEWEKQFKAVDGYDPKSDRTAEGNEALRVYTRISSPSIGFGAFVFGAVRFGTSVQAYYFIDNSDSYTYLETDLPSFEHSLRFGTSAAAAVAESKAAVGGLYGLYIGYRMRGATAFEQTHFEHIVFFPDGTAIRFLPDSGLEHFDFLTEVKKSRDYCGCYQLSGDRVTIQWGNNSTETAVVSAGPDRTLKISGDTYFPVSASDSLRLDGTYRFAATDLVAKFIRFSPDGNFEDSGMLPLVLSSAIGRNVDQSRGTGTYRIAKNTLTLLYGDRRTVAISFFVWPAEPGPRPGVIHINTYRLVRDR
jgi:hypothetical protein